MFNEPDERPASYHSQRMNEDDCAARPVCRVQFIFFLSNGVLLICSQNPNTALWVAANVREERRMKFPLSVGESATDVAPHGSIFVFRGAVPLFSFSFLKVPLRCILQ